jgi:PAS domain S-box-containing protein
MPGPVDRLLNQERLARARATAGVFTLAFAAFWLGDSAVDFALDPTTTYSHELVHPTLRELWFRLVVGVGFALLWRARLARRRYRVLLGALAAAGDGIQITDLDGTIAFSNEAVRAIYGFTPGELRGRHVNALTADPTFASREILPAIKKTGRWAGELEVRHKDGHVLPVSLTTSVVRDPSGHPLAAIGVVRDISERRRAEREAWEYARRLEEATGLKDLFADILRHDLLGPAATVQLSVESLLRREPEPAATRRMLETARRSCTKLIEIIEGAAKYAKLSTAQGIDFRALDLAAVLREVVTEFDVRARERAVRIQMHAAGPAWVRANPMIGDVFENLLSNATKYGPEGGTIWVRLDEDGPRWRVSVTDSGEGIPDADKQKVFRRFERLSKESVKGTGLGLAIAQRIVDLHGGRIWVEDAPGHGARFNVTLAKTMASDPPAPPEPPGSRAPPGPTAPPAEPA